MSNKSGELFTEVVIDSSPRRSQTSFDPSTDLFSESPCSYDPSADLFSESQQSSISSGYRYSRFKSLPSLICGWQTQDTYSSSIEWMTISDHDLYKFIPDLHKLHGIESLSTFNDRILPTTPLPSSIIDETVGSHESLCEDLLKIARTPSDTPIFTLRRASTSHEGSFDTFCSGKELTNSLVLKLHEFISNSMDVTYDHLVAWFTSKGLASDALSAQALRTSIHRVRSRACTLQGQKRESYLNELYQLPARQTSIPDVLKQKLKHAEEQKSMCEEKSQEWNVEKCMLTAACRDLKSERKAMKRKVDRTEMSKIRLKKKHSDAQEHINNQEKELKMLKKELKKKDKKLGTIKGENKCLRLRLSSRRIEIMKLKAALNTQKMISDAKHCEALELYAKFRQASEKSEEAQKALEELRNETNELLTSIEYLQVLLNDTNEFSLFDERRHLTTEAELCIMDLLSSKVGIQHVGPVIAAVSKMYGKVIANLPSEKTIRNVNDRMLALSVRHISEEFVQKEDTTLYTDETTKIGTKLGGYHASDKEGNFWVLGLRELSNKSAQMTLDVFKDILNDIDRASSPSMDDRHVGHVLLSKIKNTMSDRASTEVAFNELLSKYRTEILPDVIEKWEELEECQQSAMSRMNNFFCGLHLLVGFAETAEKVLLKFEDANTDKPVGAAANARTKLFCKNTESGTVRTIRTAAKALARGADEKSGCYRPFKNFLDQMNKKEKLERFLGNRFNILFYDAEILYYLRHDIVNFLDNVHGTTNLLLLGVSADAKEKLHIAGCKALGLCSKFITAPFWRLIESSSHILDMNRYYLDLEAFLEAAAKDPASFMTGSHTPFPADLIDKNAIFEKLIERYDDIDNLVHQFLILLFTSWKNYLCRSVKDHLPGGKLHEPSEKLKEESESAAKHNKFPERVFGLVDSLMKHRPNATQICNEAFIMFTNNRTLEWLDQKNADEKEKLLQDAHHLGRKLRENYKKRAMEIAAFRLQTMKDKQERKKELEKKNIQKKEKLLESILYYGLWQSHESMNRKLQEITTTKEKEKALSIQLKFRKLVLQQSYEDPSVFNLSCGGRKLSVHDLQTNVGKLISDALDIPPPSSLALDDRLPLLTGKYVKHYFLEDKQRVCYRGLVISTVPGFAQWYNIVYDDDDAVYTYKLLDDYSSGDLEIIVEHSRQSGH